MHVSSPATIIVRRISRHPELCPRIHGLKIWAIALLLRKGVAASF
jgi:hypothetical protein